MWTFLEELVALVGIICAFIVAAFVVVAVFALLVSTAAVLMLRVMKAGKYAEVRKGESDDAP